MSVEVPQQLHQIRACQCVQAASRSRIEGHVCKHCIEPGSIPCWKRVWHFPMYTPVGVFWNRNELRSYDRRQIRYGTPLTTRVPWYAPVSRSCSSCSKSGGSVWCMRYICDSRDSTAGIGRIAALSCELAYRSNLWRCDYLSASVYKCLSRPYHFFSAGLVLATGIIAIKTPVSKRNQIQRPSLPQRS
jgi:hypothetical protein